MQRVLAARGIGSRRHAEELIRGGRVSVDGRIVTELGTRVEASRAEIRVDGRPLRPQALRYVLLNKPRGFITTTNDDRGRRTVVDLVPSEERVYPVGRLDRDTEGLLLLTNDGDVANRVMHPRYQLAKEYHVLTRGRPSEQAMRRVRDGVVIDGRRVVPDEFRILRETRDGVILKVVIHEGLNRVVRRMMEAVHIPVHGLRRVRLGPLTVAGIPIGGWRELTPGERSTLFEALHLADHSAPPTGWRSSHGSGGKHPRPPIAVGAATELNPGQARSGRGRSTSGGPPPSRQATGATSGAQTVDWQSTKPPASGPDPRGPSRSRPTQLAEGGRASRDDRQSTRGTVKRGSSAPESGRSPRARRRHDKDRRPHGPKGKQSPERPPRAPTGIKLRGRRAQASGGGSQGNHGSAEPSSAQSPFRRGTSRHRGGRERQNVRGVATHADDSRLADREERSTPGPPGRDDRATDRRPPRRSWRKGGAGSQPGGGD